MNLKKTEVSESAKWELADMAIKAFIRQWPMQWIEFQNQLKAERTQYNIAREGGLKKSNFRNTGSFPVVYNSDGSERANMLSMMKKIFPNFVHSKYYAEFMRRYPFFRPSEKLSASDSVKRRRKFND